MSGKIRKAKAAGRRKPVFWPAGLCYALVVAVLIAFSIYSYVTPYMDNNFITGQARKFSDGWLIEEKGTWRQTEIPCRLRLGKEAQIISTLPDDLEDDWTLFVMSDHQNIQALVDGELVFEYVYDSHQRFNRRYALHEWVIIPLSKEDAGKSIRLVFEPNEGNLSSMIHTIWIGDKGRILFKMVTRQIFPVVGGVLVIILGVILIAMRFTVRREKSTEGFASIGLALLWAGVWLIVQSDLRQLLFRNGLFARNLELMSLLLIPVPLLMWADSVTKGRYRRIARRLLFAECVVMVACVLLAALEMINLYALMGVLVFMHVLSLGFMTVAYYLFRRSPRRGTDTNRWLGGRYSFFAVALVCELIIVLTGSGDLQGYPLTLCLLIFAGGLVGSATQQLMRANERQREADKARRDAQLQRALAEEKQKAAEEQRRNAEMEKSLALERQKAAEEQRRTAEMEKSLALEREKAAEEQRRNAEMEKALAEEKQKAAEEQRRTAEMEKSLADEHTRLAEEKNQAKSEFLANMSHEIRTPINAVLGMNEMVLRESSNPKVLDYATDIDTAGRHLLAIVNEILDFSKLESGKMEIVEESYSLQMLLTEVINMNRFLAERKGLEFRVQIDPALPDGLFGDVLHVRQVIVNLIDNAIKYTDKGSVTLSAAVQGEVPEKGGMLDLRLGIADTGIGIREEDRSRLFENFERLDLKRNRSIQGTGLGLAITGRLVDRMGGEIAVESEYGKGTVFTVLLPQKVTDSKPIGDMAPETRTVPVRPQEYRPSFIAPNGRVLIVDDNELNRRLVRNLLRRTQVRMDLAEGGEQALSLMRQRQYDVVLMDVMMPGMDGIETMHRAREELGRRVRRTVFIALTANAAPGVREKYLAEGFDDYLAKPVKGEDLEKMLRHYLLEDGPRLRQAKNESAALNKAAGNGTITESEETAPEDPILDTALGLQYCAGDREIYAEMLALFTDMEEETRTALSEYYDSGDFENYCVRVHSLKSTALTVGAVRLSSLALTLENASRRISTGAEEEGDRELMAEGHGKLPALYRESTERMRAYLAQPEA